MLYCTLEIFLGLGGGSLDKNAYVVSKHQVLNLNSQDPQNDGHDCIFL